MARNFNEKKWVSPTGHVRTTHRPEEDVKLRAAGYTPFEDNAAKGARVKDEAPVDEVEDDDEAVEPRTTTRAVSKGRK